MYRNSVYSFCNFSVNLKVFQNKKFIQNSNEKGLPEKLRSCLWTIEQSLTNIYQVCIIPCLNLCNNLFQKRWEELKFHIIVVVVIKAIIMILTFLNLVTVLRSLCGLCYLILHQPYEVGAATGLILHMHNHIHYWMLLSHRTCEHWR